MIKKTILFIILSLTFVFSNFVLDTYAVDPVKTSENNVSTPEFMIETKALAPGGSNIGGSPTTIIGNTGEMSLKNALQLIIENLIILIGSIAVFVMTVGGGYMIFDGGDGALLGKGKTMFKVGAISVAIALSSGILVKFVAYLLYK